MSAQHVFQNHFNIASNDPMSSAHAIKTWIKNFEETGSTLKKITGSVKSVHMPENIARVEGALPWPARSPDLSACDFFLYGYLKPHIFQPPSPRNIQELKERIWEEVARISVAIAQYDE
jgi:hypothetical protein